MGRIDAIARECIRDIGYEQDQFHHETVEITNLLHKQSAHIAQGVDAGENKDEGAGDQGIMFGYATTETEELMPAPIHYAHKILHRLAEVRKDGTEPTLRPDAESQLSVRYEDGKPVGVTSIVLSERCTLQLSYAIGVAKPLSIYVDTFGTGDVDPEKIEAAIMRVMDLTPRGIRSYLELNRPIYARTSAYGHFGRAPEADVGFSWERTDLV